jgi:hypothetical protein
MTGMKKPAFPTASWIVQAAMAAAFLVGVTGAARAQAVINQDDGGLVQWTIGMNGVSLAPGVSAVNLSGLGYATGNGSWSNGYGVSVSESTPWAGGVFAGPLDTPNGSTGSVPFFFADSSNETSSGTAAITLSQKEYFGALVDSFPNSVNTLSFYNGSTLVDTINVSALGTYFASSAEVPGYQDYASYLSVDFLGGVSYNKVVINESGGSSSYVNGVLLGEITTSTSPVSLTSLTSDQAPSPTPLPALGGTSMGLLAMAGYAFRALRRGKLRAA